MKMQNLNLSAAQKPQGIQKKALLLSLITATAIVFYAGLTQAGEGHSGHHESGKHGHETGHAGHDMHGSMHADAKAAAANSAVEVKKEMTAGEVKKLMTKRGKVSIKHEEIKSLEMPPMTMVFKVKDPAMLDGLAEGDQIEFAVDSDMVIEVIKKR